MNPRLIRTVASGFGSGLSPITPGTAGTLAAIPFAWLWSHLPPLPHLVLLALCLPFGAAVCGRAERGDGRTDPGWIVLDEMIGFWISVAFLAPSFPLYAGAFVLFRLFDILKPPPVGWVDRTMPGGWGILMDDVLAGLYVRLIFGALQLYGLL